MGELGILNMKKVSNTETLQTASSHLTTPFGANPIERLTRNFGYDVYTAVGSTVNDIADIYLTEHGKYSLFRDSSGNIYIATILIELVNGINCGNSGGKYRAANSLSQMATYGHNFRSKLHAIAYDNTYNRDTLGAIFEDFQISVSVFNLTGSKILFLDSNKEILELSRYKGINNQIDFNALKENYDILILLSFDFPTPEDASTADELEWLYEYLRQLGESSIFILNTGKEVLCREIDRNCIKNIIDEDIIFDRDGNLKKIGNAEATWSNQYHELLRQIDVAANADILLETRSEMNKAKNDAKELMQKKSQCEQNIRLNKQALKKISGYIKETQDDLKRLKDLKELKEQIQRGEDVIEIELELKEQIQRGKDTIEIEFLSAEKTLAMLVRKSEKHSSEIAKLLTTHNNLIEEICAILTGKIEP